MDQRFIFLHNPTIPDAEAVYMERIPTYQLYGETGGQTGEFWLHCETIAVRSGRYRWRIRPHRHARFFQILHITHGRVDVRLADGEHALMAPCVLAIPACAIHGFRFSKNVVGHVMTFMADRVSHLLADHADIALWYQQPRLIPVATADADAVFVGTCVRRFADDHAARLPGRTALLESLLLCVLLITYRLGEPDADSLAAAAGEPRIARLLALINTHFRAHRQVAFYARELGLSGTHLNRLASQTLGESVNRLIARRQIMEAKRHLVLSAHPVQTIAFMLGFTDPAYFTRFFHRHAGMTPTEYRRVEGARATSAAA